MPWKQGQWCQCIHSCHEFFSHHTWQTTAFQRWRQFIARCSTGTRSSALLILWLAKVSGHRRTPGGDPGTSGHRTSGPLRPCRTRINISEDLPDARRCGRRYVRNRYRTYVHVCYINFKINVGTYVRSYRNECFAHIHVSLSCQAVVGVFTKQLFLDERFNHQSVKSYQISQFQQEYSMIKHTWLWGSTFRDTRRGRS